jgi:phosphatidylglycerophosphate synthase
MEATNTPKPVQRIQQNLLAKGERRLLIAMSSRLPMAIVPDHLTALGFAGGIVIFAGYALSARDPLWLWLAVAGFIINWLGDSLDGTLARVRKIERPSFGYFIDHSTDALANVLIMTGLGLTPYLRLDIALLTLAGYLLLSIHAFLAARVVGEMRLSYLAAGPTELRLVLIAVTLCMFYLGPVPLESIGLTVFDCIVGIAGIVLVVLFIIQTLQVARRLDALSRLEAAD